MSNMLFTHNGHNMFDVSSLIQKALRRGDMEFSCYAAHEMMYKFRPYLWTRLFVTSAEDCYDPVSGRLLYLRKKDAEIKDPLNTVYLSEAVNLLVRTRKNRDSDYFACNFVCSKDKMDFPMGDSPLVTRHGHDLKEMTKALKKAIFDFDEISIGYVACEIWCWYKKLFWIVAKDVAKELGSGTLAREILALQEIDMTYNTKNSTWIYMCKAITMFLHCLHDGSTDIFSYPDMRVVYDITKFNEQRNLPNYTYDCHTRKGKAMGLTVFDFRISEQTGLNPHIQGLYDDLEWANSTKWNAEGRGEDYNTPKLPRQILDDANNGIFHTSLFDL
jgi:hypothetical protein